MKYFSSFDCTTTPLCLRSHDTRIERRDTGKLDSICINTYRNELLGIQRLRSLMRGGPLCANDGETFSLG